MLSFSFIFLTSQGLLLDDNIRENVRVDKCDNDTNDVNKIMTMIIIPIIPIIIIIIITIVISYL